MIKKSIKEIIKKALDEDIKTGDITTDAIVSENQVASGEFLVKQEGVLAGFNIVEACFKEYDDSLVLTKYYSDGDRVLPGTIAAVVEGKAKSILTVERTALNFFQRMSGIATLAHQFNEKIKHTKAKLIDTRKTVPGLRELDKLAVKLSGAENHRMGLYDMFLIKDNHIEAAGSITKAVKACKKWRNKKGQDLKIEVETKNLDEVKEAVNCKVDVIMLDNFNIKLMREAVVLINGKSKVEASGMVNLDTVAAIAETGVDYISAGALTHSVKALDISLNIKMR
ncbi:MAG TPA: carboxylating nicotinate-nucleotide diphosphorylase [Ignavibacteriaceae bacterium]|nr:carboxylating nicotinate-nucleotide diphosphorylase [Ignavibacteriaceae bacterium]